MAEEKATPKQGDKVSVTEDGQVYHGSVRKVKEGFCEVEFTDGEEGTYEVKDVTVDEPTPEVKKTPAKPKAKPAPEPAAKSKEQLEAEAAKLRKAQVDAANRKKAKEAAAAEAELANVPLNGEERAFIERITPMMKEGRAVAQPSPAEMLRYSKLVKRKDVQ